MKMLLLLALAGLSGPPAVPHSPHQGRPQPRTRANAPARPVGRGKAPLTGLVSYSLRDGQQGPGWFAKNAGQVSSTYWFYHDQFAALTTHARNQGRQLLADEATYLFGQGQPQGAAFGQTTYQWRGQRVLVELTDGHNETSLSISSRPLQARQAADQQAKQQAEAAARAAKFKADNAAPVR